jgi:hypothetical protein
MRGCFIAFIVGSCAFSANAQYLVTARSLGLDTRNVAPGETFSLDIAITGAAGDRHQAAVFQVVFSFAGLEYDAYSWAEPYANGTLDDFSTPDDSMLPLLLDADSLSGPAFPTGVTDIDMQNVLPLGAPDFTSGRIVTLTLRVPADWSGPDQVQISVIPDQFTRFVGGQEFAVPATAGTPFTLVVPAPGIGAAGVMLMAAAGSRRRRS